MIDVTTNDTVTGEVIDLSLFADRRPSATERSGREGRILFFTGVRYERMEEPAGPRRMEA